MHVTQTYGPYIGLHREARRNDATCMCAKGYGGTGPSDECRVPCPGNRNQICGGANGVTFLHTFLGNWNVHCVSKNAPSLADCSFDKDGLILIIFGQLHQHTFKNGVFNYPYSFTFTYFICFQIAATEMMRNNVFSTVNCWWL